MRIPRVLAVRAKVHGYGSSSFELVAFVAQVYTGQLDLPFPWGNPPTLLEGCGVLEDIFGPTWYMGIYLRRTEDINCCGIRP